MSKIKKHQIHQHIFTGTHTSSTTRTHLMRAYPARRGVAMATCARDHVSGPTLRRPVSYLYSAGSVTCRILICLRGPSEKSSCKQ